MDPPPPPATMAPPTPPPPDSIDSSPRSRTTDTWDDPQPPPRLRLMCSYGGHIVPRPHDKSLCYVGGETRIVVADRNSSLSDLSGKLSKTLLGGRAFTLKYQLPSEDLDSLISVTTDEDLDNMVDEYDRTRPNRLRLFLFPAASVPSKSADSDDWFVAALNSGGGNSAGVGSGRGFSDSASVNCLLGLDDDVLIAANGNGNSTAAEPPANAHQQQKKAQELQSVSVPDSPMLDTTSSFGSTSSSPSLTNLPPIRVHVDGGGVGGIQDQKAALIDDQFSQMSLSAAAKQDDVGGGILSLSSPPSAALNPISASSSSLTGIGIDYVAANRVISDDERSDQGGAGPIGYRKQQIPPPSKQTTAVIDLPSPDSVSSDSSFGNPMNRTKPIPYHQQQQEVLTTTKINQNQPFIVDLPKLNSNNSTNIISDPSSGYVFHPQFVQNHPAGALAGAPGGAHYIHHQAPPPQANLPISAAAYYHHPVYTSHTHSHSQPPPQPQPHIDHQFPVYYIPAPPQPQQQPPPASMNITEPKPEMYHRTPGNPTMVQVPTSAQQHYVGYTQVRHHPSQSTAAAPAGYAYDYAAAATAAPGHQVYYTQQLGLPPMPSQYQTIAGATVMGIRPEGSGQIPVDGIKQQTRTSQPL